MALKFEGFKYLPKAAVFDLDYTLWPLYVDCLSGPPFRLKNHIVTDRSGSRITFYKDVPLILHSLKDHGIKIGIASRTGAISWAEKIVQLIPLPQIQEDKSSNSVTYSKTLKNVVDAIEIYPTSKVRHIKQIAKKFDINLNEILFFDDENRNIHDIRGIGVTSILVNNGMTVKVLHEGLKKFNNNMKDIYS
ncbi:putative magnesium-dependent phosphatase 1,putative [Neocallimastix lanati (nom. inval.)]|jgi:magnesium-dependent phosphatase 1|uniref:Magnesium-dependent phosphatase 1,putative n=1 Tax=Neocallimastix californiae TaxID=1754190 RepID=A0A1Y2AYY7_9FUNG|nr:putative magnesium-dependent phosphatase 1,putative [Neocallimastix sp. JGI-2020a]ORY27510.1 magnesium-dependent phosphatase 1,putative [Neocallimastix californiae]|eukprot:ORY27510.1 magnesium-dependent phosphatase 1,putative [Neocallimastix californiae]